MIHDEIVIFILEKNTQERLLRKSQLSQKHSIDLRCATDVSKALHKKYLQVYILRIKLSNSNKRAVLEYLFWRLCCKFTSILKGQHLCLREGRIIENQWKKESSRTFEKKFYEIAQDEGLVEGENFFLGFLNWGKILWDRIKLW